MSAPDLGPCRCEVDDPDGRIDRVSGWRSYVHEHSDFEPYPCAEPGCWCDAWVEAAVDGAESPAPGPEPVPAGVRKGVTLPAQLDFASERVRNARIWLDSIVLNSERFGNPDDPAAVCDLADTIEQSGPAFDPIDALALAALRLGARQRMNAREVWDAMRRKVRR